MMKTTNRTDYPKTKQFDESSKAKIFSNLLVTIPQGVTTDKTTSITTEANVFSAVEVSKTAL